MIEKKEIKKEIIIGVFLLVLSILVLALLSLSIFVFSDIEIFSASQQNISMCNVQGSVFSSGNLAVLNGTNISCTIARNNGINTTYTTLTGKGVPADGNYNNSYRCAMTCSNVIADTISVLTYNSTNNGTSTGTMSGSTKILNITFTDYVAPIITSITGNKSGYTNQTITIEINATDDISVVGGNITLGNGTVINASLVGSNYTANLTLPSNSLLTINYTAFVYDAGNNNATSVVYYITVSDNIAPTSVASVNQSTVDQNVNIQFNGSNSSDNIGVVSYLWNFNDSSTNTSEVALHKFASSGTYNVSLNVTDAAGNNGFGYVTVTVRDSSNPYVVSNMPANGSANISLMTSINITFNEAMLLSTLTMDNIDIKDNNSNKVYGNITFDSTLNKTIIWPYVLLSESMAYIVNVTTNVQDTSTNNISIIYKFNFTTKARDTDNDNIPDNEETDDDNDGVLDENDKVKGNASNIKTDLSLATINVSINGSTNLSNVSSVFNTSANVEINNGTAPIVIFSIDFSNTTLDLTNLSIYESDNQTISAIIIHGLKLATGQTKTIYLANKTNYTSVCVKDMEVTSFSQITQACNSTNEFKIVCNNTEQYSYTCIHNTTINKFMINGLNYSGIREINYIHTQTTPDGGNGGGGGGGGGGGAEKPLTITTKETPPVITSPVFPAGGSDEEEAGEQPIDTGSKEGEGVDKELIESKETGEEKGLIQEAESKEGASLAGKAYKVILENKANLSLLLLLSLLAASVVIFNILHEKRKKE